MRAALVALPVSGTVHIAQHLVVGQSKPELVEGAAHLRRRSRQLLQILFPQFDRIEAGRLRGRQFIGCGAAQQHRVEKQAMHALQPTRRGVEEMSAPS
nr:hypothetical protein [Xanthomonas euroxanthea]